MQNSQKWSRKWSLVTKTFHSQYRRKKADNNINIIWLLINPAGFVFHSERKFCHWKDLETQNCYSEHIASFELIWEHLKGKVVGGCFVGAWMSMRLDGLNKPGLFCSIFSSFNNLLFLGKICVRVNKELSQDAVKGSADECAFEPLTIFWDSSSFRLAPNC